MMSRMPSGNKPKEVAQMEKVVWLPEDNWVVVSESQVIAHYRLEDAARRDAKNSADTASGIQFFVAHLVGSYVKTKVPESEKQKGGSRK